MPEQLVPSLVIGALVLLAFAGMALGWRARRRRQSGLDALEQVPAALGPARFGADLLYVATTLAEQPLERVAVAGLGVRGRARVDVHDEGVVLAIRGSRPAFVPASAIVSAGLGTYTIDRVVERDGLAVLTWRLGDGVVDTYLRADSAPAKRELVAAVIDIAPGSLTSNAGSPEGDPRGNS